MSSLPGGFLLGGFAHEWSWHGSALRRGARTVQARCTKLFGQPAAKTQVTCGSECRQLRRSKHERKRRAADVAAARADERERQRRHRERQRASAGASPPMSRAGLSAEATVVIEEIVAALPA
ncbi:MAG: hypothetical protein ACT4TC_19420 [Myxococcaceae bacterium]